MKYSFNNARVEGKKRVVFPPAISFLELCELLNLTKGQLINVISQQTKRDGYTPKSKFKTKRDTWYSKKEFLGWYGSIKE